MRIVAFTNTGCSNEALNKIFQAFKSQIYPLLKFASWLDYFVRQWVSPHPSLSTPRSAGTSHYRFLKRPLPFKKTTHQCLSPGSGESYGRKRYIKHVPYGYSSELSISDWYVRQQSQGIQRRRTANTKSCTNPSLFSIPKTIQAVCLNTKVDYHAPFVFALNGT